ncbi:hypothetical protein [Nocardia seriolae]|uniref:Transposase n=1 Tax=Nocardia seriolae TaxID=37332 RepID=A0A0B8N723_9NOCA|nr:hypothetical protein [Nocardia seriolae]APB00264.1 hypothetical protein NS506_06228 [Nocardia seriolae]MTJ64935.1 hypothetical protein [Nocardia seriolae]MTJ70961.1 hypothetical protein [Nocardia seriolae]MTJ89752.1 hypothetical protein [Nocardia seriolae]MTK33727.1 hypothetical protein [Nocardia seriolae]
MTAAQFPRLTEVFPNLTTEIAELLPADNGQQLGGWTACRVEWVEWSAGQ